MTEDDLQANKVDIKGGNSLAIGKLGGHVLITPTKVHNLSVTKRSKLNIKLASGGFAAVIMKN